MNGPTKKGRNGTCPKMTRGNIGRHHANFPQARETPEDFMRCLRSNSASAVATKNKKLRHIPDRLTARDFRPSLHKDQPGQFAVHPDKERISSRLAPIKRKGFVPEPAIRPNRKFLKFTEVVTVQLEQVFEDRFLLRGRGDDLKLRGWLL